MNMIKVSAKAISPLIATVVVLSITITASIMVISSLTSVTKSQTTAVASRVECAGALLNIIETNCGSSNWWNSSWSYRMPITITNNNLTQVLEQNYTVNITFNHSQLVSQGKSLPSGNNIRIVWYNSTSGQNIELDRINTTPFNNPSSLTVLWFKLQQNISANQSDTNYFLYYGNPSAGAAPANGSNVFISYADFSSSAGWTTVSNGDDSIVNQRIEFQSNDAEGSYIYKDLGFNTGDFQLDYEVYISSANLNPNAIVGGFSDSVGKYSVWINGIYAYVYAHDVGGQRFGLGVRKNSVQTDITITTWSWGGSIWYYLRLRRVGSTAYFYIYSDAQRTSLLASTSFPDASTTGFRYKYGYTGAWAGYGSEVISGYVDTMQLRKYLSPEPSAALGTDTYSFQAVVYNPSSVELTNLSLIAEIGEKAYVNTTQLAVKSGELQFINIEVPQGEIKNLRVSAGNCPVWIERKKAGTCG